MNHSLDEFAQAIGIGRQTLIRIENGTRQPKPHELAAMAAVTGLPIEFFTTPDLTAALAGTDDEPTLTQRVEKLERAQAEAASSITSLRVAVASLAADLLRREQELQALRGTGRPEERRRGTG